MFFLIRKNHRPTALRKLVSKMYQEPVTTTGSGRGSSTPSHHILCAGTYTPVFARLAAESALAAVPETLKEQFKLFIHVDGVASRQRRELTAWLREIPGIEVSYGMFGILSRDRIPGKWHQVMINDIVREFHSEPHIAFLDADLFLVDESWWEQGISQINSNVYSITLGLRNYAHINHQWAAKTQLFSINTALHQHLNQQRFNKDIRAIQQLRQEFPSATLEVTRPDTMVASSLRAQAHGHPVVDVYDQVPHCHVGGFSHLSFNKFHNHDDPKRKAAINSWISSTRLLLKLLNYFEQRGWGTFIDAQYRNNANNTKHLIKQHIELQRLMDELPLSPHEQAFQKLVTASHCF